MFAHIMMVSLPASVLVLMAIRYVQGMLQNALGLRGNVKTALNILTYVAIGLVCIALVYTSIVDGYCFIPESTIAIAVSIDVLILGIVIVLGWSEVIRPILHSGQLRDLIIVPVAWALIIVIFATHLFFSMAAVFNLDWAFRPFVDEAYFSEMKAAYEEEKLPGLTFEYEDDNP